jgi:hypothetical protein
MTRRHGPGFADATGAVPRAISRDAPGRVGLAIGPAQRARRPHGGRRTGGNSLDFPCLLAGTATVRALAGRRITSRHTRRRRRAYASATDGRDDCTSDRGADARRLRLIRTRRETPTHPPPRAARAFRQAASGLLGSGPQARSGLRQARATQRPPGRIGPAGEPGDAPFGPTGQAPEAAEAVTVDRHIGGHAGWARVRFGHPRAVLGLRDILAPLSRPGFVRPAQHAMLELTCRPPRTAGIGAEEAVRHRDLRRASTSGATEIRG